MMDMTALQWLFVAAGTTPFVFAALNGRRLGCCAIWWPCALLALVLSSTADPMAVALRHVDGVMTRAICSP